MNICNLREHEEIVYTSRNCPMCEALRTIESLEARINELDSHECEAQ